MKKIKTDRTQKEIILSDAIIEDFRRELVSSEKSGATVEKYLRDINAFRAFVEKEGLDVTKSTVIEYKKKLLSDDYSIRSINSMLSSLNSFFNFIGRQDCKVKLLKLQRTIYCNADKELTKEEYKRLVNAANKKSDERLSLILQTICGTGIRVSELRYITLQSAKSGVAFVSLKGKSRPVFIVKELQKKLIRYAAKHKIRSGCIFLTQNGRPISRTSVWREMKSLCNKANVDQRKVFPHNLRHLFARIFYKLENDIAKLADILGHSSIETTRIYIMTTGSEHRRRMENMHLII